MCERERETLHLLLCAALLLGGAATARAPTIERESETRRKTRRETRARCAFEPRTSRGSHSEHEQSSNSDKDSDKEEQQQQQRSSAARKQAIAERERKRQCRAGDERLARACG
jgi:hypothetical protein